MSMTPKHFPAPIRDFIAAIKARVAEREPCRTCPLAGRPVVVLDTNLQEPGPVDVAFLGLNPGSREVEQDRPFVGPAGQLLRARLESLRPGSRWLITNVLLSHTRNEAEIPRPDVAMAHCRELVESILAAFPPRLLVPAGAKPLKWCGVPDAMTAASGRLYDTARGPVMPLVHPSAVKRFPAKWGPLFDESFRAIAAELDRRG